nr:hypothetical protein [Tanacetum cinerariifolium]
MGRDTVQLETAISTISQEYLLEFTSEYGISEALHPELPGLEDMIVDFPEGKAGVYTKVDVLQQEAWEKYPVILHQALRLFKKLEQPLLLGGREGVPNYRILAHECSKGWDAGRENVLHGGCENTRHTPYLNPETTRGTTLLSGVKPQILLGRRDIDLFNLIRAPNPTKVKTGSRPQSSGVPTTIERSPLDFANENALQQSTGPEDQKTTAPEVPPPERTDCGREYPWGESLASIELGMGSTRPSPTPQGMSADVSDQDPLSFADPQSRPSTDVAQSSKGAAAAGDPESENTSCAFMVGSLKSIYWPEWGITNRSMLDTPEACQDLVDHVASPGYFLKLRHLHNDDFLKQYNVNLARQVSTLQEQVSGEEKLKAAFEEFKRYEDKGVEQRCAEMDARLDALSIDFDEELYPHMLTAIAGRRWMIRRGLRLAVMKCSESIELRALVFILEIAPLFLGFESGIRMTAYAFQKCLQSPFIPYSHMESSNL